MRLIAATMLVIILCPVAWAVGVEVRLCKTSTCVENLKIPDLCAAMDDWLPTYTTQPFEHAYFDLRYLANPQAYLIVYTGDAKIVGLLDPQTDLKSVPSAKPCE